MYESGQDGQGYTEIRRERFTVVMQPCGTEALVAAYLRCDFATPEVAAYLADLAGIGSWRTEDYKLVGVHGRAVHLMNAVHLVMEDDGRWRHDSWGDLTRNRTCEIRLQKNGKRAIWQYDRSVDRACHWIDRCENDLLYDLLEGQNSLVEQVRGGGVLFTDPSYLPPLDPYGQAIRSLVALDLLPPVYNRRRRVGNGGTPRQPARAKRRKRK